jgi:hypothetical protein
MSVTNKFWGYLEREGDRWTLLLPPLAFFGTITTLIVDAIAYIVSKNTDKVPTWTPPNRRDWHKPLLHAFEPVSYFAKNLFETFKPYKYNSGVEFLRILKQPLEGLAFICTGIWRTVATPLYGIGKIALIALSILGNIEKFSTKMSDIGKEIVTTVANTANGIARIVTGALQLALTPFSWFVKPLIRLGIHAVSDKNDLPRIENNTGLQKRVEATKKQSGNDLSYTLTDIHRKFAKCQQRGEATNVDTAVEATTFVQLDLSKPETVVNYQKLFAKRNDSRSVAPSPSLTDIATAASAYNPYVI